MRKTRTTLTIAIGIGLLVGSTVGVAAQEEAVEVTGEVRFSGSMGSIETWATNDPRLTGTGTWDPTEGFPMDRTPSYFLNGRFLETDEGTWRQLPVPTVNIPGQQGSMPEREGDPVWDMVLVGEGGYEGLVFIAQATWVDDGFDVHGYIADAAAS